MPTPRSTAIKIICSISPFRNGEIILFGIIFMMVFFSDTETDGVTAAFWLTIFISSLFPIGAIK